MVSSCFFFIAFPMDGCPVLVPGAKVADDHSCDKEREANDRQEEKYIPRIENALLEGQRESQTKEKPRGEKFANDRLPGSHRHREQEFHGALAPLLRPQAH